MSDLPKYHIEAAIRHLRLALEAKPFVYKPQTETDILLRGLARAALELLIGATEMEP